MAFENKNLSVLAYANGFTLWHYKSNDAIETICNPGYFDRIRTIINHDDIFIINGKNGSSIKRLVMDDLDTKTKLQKLN